MPTRDSVCKQCRKPIFLRKDGTWHHRYLVDFQPVHEIVPTCQKKGVKSMNLEDADREMSKERLQKEIGYLFRNGITDTIFEFCAAFDGNNIPKKKLEDMCDKAGISHIGHKKLLAAKLLANEFPLPRKQP